MFTTIYCKIRQVTEDCQGGSRNDYSAAPPSSSPLHSVRSSSRPVLLHSVPLTSRGCSLALGYVHDDGHACSGSHIASPAPLQQKENAATQAEPGLQSAQCVHNSAIAVNEKRSSQISAQSGNRIPDRAPMTYSTCCKTAETSPDSPSPAVNKDQPRSIRPGDYKKLEIPEPKTPCYYCGKKGTRYIEKYTKERRARPRDQQEARRICRSCYDEVVKAEQTASVPLPGIVDVSRCTRVTVDVGKCSVCGVAKAVWLDRETGVKLCEQCYGRGVREEAREAGLV